MSFFAHCGTFLPDNFIFCSVCGTKVSVHGAGGGNVSNKKRQPPKRKNNCNILEQKYSVVFHSDGLIIGKEDFDNDAEAEIHCNLYRGLYQNKNYDIDVLPEGQPWLGQSFLDI